VRVSVPCTARVLCGRSPHGGLEGCNKRHCACQRGRRRPLAHAATSGECGRSWVRVHSCTSHGAALRMQQMLTLLLRLHEPSCPSRARAALPDDCARCGCSRSHALYCVFVIIRTKSVSAPSRWRCWCCPYPRWHAHSLHVRGCVFMLACSWLHVHVCI
jgi:hypothetical protein